ncbi:MAG TPA: cell wall hydrolase [Allosphingosinicella sp.]|nr:cell wall hydrolase [Allosphingosinicella sp.]
MIRILRAAGFAAAAVALIASASSPSFAVDLQGTPDASVMAHGVMQVEDSDLDLNDESSNDALPVARQLGAAAPVTAIFQHAIAWLGSEDDRGDVPAPAILPQGLGELVETYADLAIEDAQDICLAKAVYFEARSEPLEGQLAVAQVVMNRAASGRYPSTLCAVITQRAQFSFIRAGRFPKPNKKSEAWRKAVGIAHIAKAGLVKELAPDVLWYHATYVAPTWGKRLNKQAQIGLHIFYS